MARDRTPRDAFGRPLDPDADFGPGPSHRSDGSDGAFDTTPGATVGPSATEGPERPFGTTAAPAPDRPFGTTAPAPDHPFGTTAWDPAAAAQGVERVRRPEEHPGLPAAGPAAGTGAANPQATVALVLGAVGLVFVPYLLSIAAIVVANRADRVADALPGEPGRSTARAGRILGYVGLGLWVVLPVLFVFFLLVASTGSV